MIIGLITGGIRREMRSSHVTSNLSQNTGPALNHTHANLTVLNGIGVINNELVFNGEVVDDKTMLLSEETW